MDKFYFHALREIAKNDITADELVALALELGKVNYHCMALLDKAKYGKLRRACARGSFLNH